MANNCTYEMRIAGKKETVEKIYEFAKEHSYTFCEIFMELDPNIEEESEYEADMRICGDVKWSIVAAWNMDKYKPRDKYIEEALKDPGTPVNIKTLYSNMEEERIHGPSILDVKGEYIFEIFSEEAGNSFQEHYIVKNGELLVDDAREYLEYWIEEDETETLNGGYSEWKLDFDINKEIPPWDNECRR